MVVFFDIDGTIVDEETQEIPQSTIRAIEALRRNGHIALINTGRPYSHIDPRVREMDFRGWVCGCGMEVMLDDSWLAHYRPEEAVRKTVVEACRKYGMKPAYEADEAIIVLDGDYSDNPFIQWDVEQLRSKGFTFRQMNGALDTPFIKLIAFMDESSDLEGFIRTVEPWFTVIIRGKIMVELVLKGCSKAQGMLLVMDRLGISAEETLALGDSTNDLPMLQLAGHTVCMGNGAEEVKAVCEYVTSSVMEDGIEQALKHFGLI